MIKIIKAPKLKKGDWVGIVSPSGPVIFKNKILAGAKELEKLGLRVCLGKNVFKKHGGYMAGTIKERMDDFHSMFKNVEIKAIFASRGGFCANQLLPFMDFSLIKRNPKIVLGYSDITALINAIYAKTGLITFHGPNVELTMSKWDDLTRNSFIKSIFQDEPIGKISKMSSYKVLKSGAAKGRLLGGNLSVLRTLIGTKYNPDWAGAILFWEDCDLTDEDLDHFITHLELSGVLGQISGMVIGKNKNFKETNDNFELKKPSPFSSKEIILERTYKHHFPIISKVQFGHIGEQITIPIGAQATIDTSQRLFSIDEGGVI